MSSLEKETEYNDYWWCPECKQEVHPGNVTYEEFHDTCGTRVILKIENENPVKKVNHEKYPEFECIETYFCREEIDLDKNVNIALSEGWKILDVKIIQETDKDGSCPIFCAIMGLPKAKE